MAALSAALFFFLILPVGMSHGARSLEFLFEGAPRPSPCPFLFFSSLQDTGSTRLLTFQPGVETKRHSLIDLVEAYYFFTLHIQGKAVVINVFLQQSSTLKCDSDNNLH